MLKNITFSAEDALIQQARKRAAAENQTLNDLFRGWLARYVAQPGAAEQYQALMSQLSYVKTSRAFSREEMNERR